MPIPESRLSRWSHHGPQDASIKTHETIRKVLAAHSWPSGMTYDFFLQGSYRNNTNISGDSDVDVMLELNSIFQYDESSLSQSDRNRLAKSFEPPKYDWNDFRREALKALTNGFGGGFVSQGNKSIKLKANRTRLAADIVVCMEHRKFTSHDLYEKGVTFYALQDKRWILNYPKQHYDNGADKSKRTGDRYKQTVRMFKNARNHLASNNLISSNFAPSYFLECLLYNVPDSAFQLGFQDTYCSVVNWMSQSDLARLVCQNEQMYLFGSSPQQWSLNDAKALVNQFITLWHNWS